MIAGVIDLRAVRDKRLGDELARLIRYLLAVQSAR
jgi:hypothetical protein